MQTLRYGVIGCGRVSARHIQCADEMEHTTLAALVDPDTAKAERFAAEAKSSPTVYADYGAMLADDVVDVVVICVPTQMHAAVATAAAAAGKHIYCEKAMAPTLADCRAMIRAADDAGVKLNIGQSTRFQVPFVQARRVVEAGRIGEVIAVDGAFPGTATTPDSVPADFWRFKAGAQGHGYVVNFGCHYVDAARYICGDDPAQVSAFIGNRFSAGQIPEDQFVITAVCHGGTIITIGMYCAPTHTPMRTNGFVVHGTEGILEAYWRPGGVTLTLGSQEPEPVDFDDDLAVDSWLRFHRQFRDCILEDTDPPVSGRDGMLNVEWALAAYLAHERRAWMDLPLGPEFYEYGGPKLYREVPAGGQ